MRLLDARNRIRTLMAQFRAEVQGASATDTTDTHRTAEDFLVALFPEVYGYHHLRNLNETEQRNYPGIDLADDEARVAIQVTATSDSDKVQHTLRTFCQYKLYERYQRLIIYVLTDKQKRYSSEPFDRIIQGKFTFDPKQDILDYTDVLKSVNNRDLAATQRVLQILEEHLVSGLPRSTTSATTTPQVIASRSTETIYLNLLQITVPDNIYIADVLPEVFPKRRWQRRKQPTAREQVQQALAKQELKFAADWECFEKKIVTFHDLSDETLPLAKIIDLGTVTSLLSKEFYSVSEDYEHVFKSLLRRCLQQKLWRKGVAWQNEENLFIFVSSPDQENTDRIEHWHGDRNSHRTVYLRIMDEKQPDKILCHKHFAFRVQFKRFNDAWYLLISPDWFFSWNGYQKWRWHQDWSDGQKKLERNPHIFNHLRFVAYFLQQSDRPQLFTVVHPFLHFGNLVTFGNSPSIDDAAWNPKEKPDEPKSDGIDQMELL